MVRTAVPRRIGAPPLLPSLADNDAIEIGQAIRRANGRVGGKPRVLRDIVKAFRRPHRCARCRFACPTGTAVSQGFRTASRRACDVPHRRAMRVLAENLGKPTLSVNINEIWYKLSERDSDADRPDGRRLPSDRTSILRQGNPGKRPALRKRPQPQAGAPTQVPSRFPKSCGNMPTTWIMLSQVDRALYGSSQGLTRPRRGTGQAPRPSGAGTPLRRRPRT